MIDTEAHSKVTCEHLGRLAYLYIRQSSLRQVLENTESTHRQYACGNGQWHWAGPRNGSW